MISLNLGQLPPSKRYSVAIFSFVFIIAGFGHILFTQHALPYMPEWMPLKWHLIFWTGFTEIIGGVGLLIQTYRKFAAQFLLLHLVAYLSLHGWHVWVGGVLQPNEIELPIWVVWIRLLFQFVLIWLMAKLTQNDNRLNYQTTN